MMRTIQHPQQKTANLSPKMTTMRTISGVNLKRVELQQQTEYDTLWYRSSTKMKVIQRTRTTGIEVQSLPSGEKHSAADYKRCDHDSIESQTTAG
mmetsp:Transcript_21245/g.38121  ORF Transcript_21245/g.38121 Transcript_21245/m.38121 type:complete len:95 (-) Transcript_21245:1091-1375(-)